MSDVRRIKRWRTEIGTFDTAEAAHAAYLAAKRELHPGNTLDAARAGDSARTALDDLHQMDHEDSKT